ncbi:B12-binding domain-containing radical SAM protein [Propionibacterium freudenreichii]|uniref:B12-binding domain-containing radical SAM protein n=1 Tax=Propionibacterium freudenreichii TaxID=1744 RepID=UPI000B1D0237|nr:radical SAM protein [Propionibacterium freudenreichii]MDK9675508.1 hypothetical protein [Propionibacterium freudenreichii]SCQ47320.1 Radical SAM domain protein [Propionibacterium freudenreichii]SCQ55191.1 Radical SAM domain protein [Propionibacterium freudenreichii]
MKWALTEHGPRINHIYGRPTIALLNTNPFAEGIANLGAQAIAWDLIKHGYNVDFGFADTQQKARPLLSGINQPKDISVVAVSVPFEDTYHHVPRMLRNLGLEPLSADRATTDPIVVGGGMSMINPMPLAPFFDAIVVGEGRSILPKICDLVQTCSGVPRQKSAILEDLLGMESVFVPCFYEFEYDSRGAVIEKRVRNGAPPEIHAARTLDVNSSPITSHWTTDRAVYKYPDYFSVMVAMGCHLKCPFCVVGNVQGSESGRALTMDAQNIVNLAAARRESEGTNLVKLFFTSSFATNPHIDKDDMKTLLHRMLSGGFEARVGSLNIRQADNELLDLIKRSGQVRVTFAPETGETLRQSVGKPYSRDASLIEVASSLGRYGLGLDLYTMLGLPYESRENVQELGGLIRRVRDALDRKEDLEVSTNPVFVKAQTPYERFSTMRPEAARARFRFLRKTIGDQSGIKWVSVIDDPMAYYQPILSTGGVELAPVISALSKQFRPSESAWRRQIRDLVGSDLRYFRERGDDEVLPWEHIIYRDHRRLSKRLDAHRMRAKGGGHVGSS